MAAARDDARLECGRVAWHSICQVHGRGYPVRLSGFSGSGGMSWAPIVRDRGMCHLVHLAPHPTRPFPPYAAQSLSWGNMLSALITTT